MYIKMYLSVCYIRHPYPSIVICLFSCFMACGPAGTSSCDIDLSMESLDDPAYKKNRNCCSVDSFNGNPERDAILYHYLVDAVVSGGYLVMTQTHPNVPHHFDGKREVSQRAVSQIRGGGLPFTLILHDLHNGTCVLMCLLGSRGQRSSGLVDCRVGSFPDPFPNGIVLELVP